MSLRKVYDFEKALLPICMAITQRGMQVDEALRLERIAQLSAILAPLQEEAAQVVAGLRDKLKKPELMWKTKACPTCHNGKKKKLTCASCGGAGRFESFNFNLGSNQQLVDVLYNGLKLPLRLKDKKPTADEEALQSLAAIDKSGFVAFALKYAKAKTMQEIYERLEPAKDGRIRTILNPAGTLTGRFSSRGAFYVEGSTNLQNMPNFEAGRDKLYDVRECIVPTHGTVFLDADLSQAEARVTACLSGDEELLQRWRQSGFDVHRWTAAAMFSKSEAEVSGKERYLGKVARHALNYGMGVVRFWRHVNANADVTGVSITMAEARRIHAAYHKLHPKLATWWEEVEWKLRRSQPVTTCFGRRAAFYPRIDAQTETMDHDSLGAAIAYEPQSTIADLLNEGLLCLWGVEHELFRIVMQVHDSILVECKREDVKLVADLMRDCMERRIQVRDIELIVPVDIKLCETNWAQKVRI